MIILCDMDGVIANLVGALIRTHGLNLSDSDWDKFDKHHEWGMTTDELFAPTKDNRWWLELEPYPWAEELLTELRKLGKVIFCTAPPPDASVPSQKVQWLREHGFLAADSTDYIITRFKHLNAGPGVILLDDADHMIDQYRSCSGHALQFPQPWNQCRHLLPCDRVRYVVEQLAPLAAK